MRTQNGPSFSQPTVTPNVPPTVPPILPPKRWGYKCTTKCTKWGYKWRKKDWPWLKQTQSTAKKCHQRLAIAWNGQRIEILGLFCQDPWTIVLTNIYLT